MSHPSASDSTARFGAKLPVMSSLTSAACGVLLAAPVLAWAQASTGNADASATQTITVMGEKMGRSERESTTAVTVFTADDIASRNRASVLDLVAEVPNVTIGEFGGVANIRGTNGAGPGFSSLAWRGATRARTATIVDGVSQIWTGGNLLSTGLWDVAQLEVLRGPQSTMQGRSAVGGAIVIKTRDPSFKPEAALRLGLQQANGEALGQVAAMASGPLSDGLAYRLSADLSGGSSFVDYVDNNTNTGVDFSADPDKVQRADIKAKLLFAPAHNPDLVSRLDLQHQAQKGPYLNQVNLGDDGDYRASTDQVNHRIGDTSLTTLVSNTSYQLGKGRSLDLLLSASRLDAGFTHNQTAPAATNTNNYFRSRTEQDSTGAEVRLNLGRTDGGLRSMVGLSRFGDDMSLLARAYSGAIRYSGDTKTSATSVFGELELPIGERLTLIAGGRLERESQDRTVTNGTANAARKESKTYALPRAALRFDLNPQTVLGLDMRRGYNPAGISMDTDSTRIYTYETEYVTAVEASIQQRFNGGKGTWSAHLFNNRFKDYQARNGSVIGNIDEATIRGLELAVTTELGGATRVYANASVQSSRIDAFAATPAYVGNKLPYAAPRTFGAGVTHRLAAHWTLAANAKHVAEYHVDISNAAGPGQQARAGGYTLLDVSASVALSAKTSVRAYVNNLADRYVINTYFQGTTTQDVLAPRTVGLQLDHRF